jgi:hypothetical protein
MGRSLQACYPGFRFAHPGIAIEISSDFTSSAAFPPVIPPQNQPVNRPRASDEWIRGPLDRCQASMRWCSTAAFVTRPASLSRVSPARAVPTGPLTKSSTTVFVSSAAATGDQVRVFSRRGP